MPHTILIVADNPAQLHILKMVVADKLRYQAVTAASADVAFDMVFSSKLPTPDLLLVDLGRGNMDGKTRNWLKLIRAVRKRNADFPIIILTEYGEHEYATQAIEAGANDFLTKPVATARLSLSLSNAFRLRHLQQTIKKLEQKLLTDKMTDKMADRVIVQSPITRRPVLVDFSPMDGFSPVDGDGKIKNLRKIEEDAIRFALETCGNSMSKAARMLGIGRSTLYRKVGEIERNHTARENQTTRPMIEASALDFS